MISDVENATGPILGLLLALAYFLPITTRAEVVIPPGQDELVTSMLSGADLPDRCQFVAGAIEPNRIRATYSCAEQRYEINLEPRSSGSDHSTDKFNLELGSSTVPPSLVAALLRKIRAAESDFVWQDLEPIPSRPPLSTPTGASEPSPAPTDQRARLEQLCRAAASEAMRGKRPTLKSGLPPTAQLERDLRPIYECLVVAKDSATYCERLPAHIVRNCEARWMFFHEARQADEGADWPAILAPALHADCTSEDRGAATPICDQIESAVRRQEPARCPRQPPPIHLMCSAIASSDPDQCGGSADCAELAGRLQLLARGGLAELAKSGTERDRTHARAALGDPTACEPLAERFVESCIAGDGPAKGRSPAIPTTKK